LFWEVFSVVQRDPNNVPVVLRVEDVGRILGINRAAAYELVKSEGFPSIRIGRRILVPLDSLNEWLKTASGARNAP